MTHQQTRGYLYNWLSLSGIILSVLGFVGGIVLLAMDFANPNATVYSGIFTYLIVPFILIVGLVLIVWGWLRERRRQRGANASFKRMPVLDLNERKHYVVFVTIVTVVFLFIVLSGIGSYSAYKYTESVAFCGTTCHTPMTPEHTACAQSPHAHVSCVECHIGPGAEWFVKAKLSGLHQVYAVAVNDFNRPIKTPIQNLRPASETCYECHWPAKFFGNLEQTKTYFAADKSNTPYTISYLLPVGGGDPRHGPARGIHYHMSVEKKIEYVAKDERRQIIPWVRVTDHEGNVSVYETTSKGDRLSEAEMAAQEPRVMDCMDCHNRPAHQFRSPNATLDQAMSNGRIDPSIPFIKKNTAKALLGEYATQPEGLAAIEKQLRAAYPEGGPKIDAAIAETKEIYRQNFFPEMKVRWDAYPDNIGHWSTPGCFRCHDGLHKNEKGEIISRDCKTCHVITSQGPGLEPTTYVREGLDFVHPAEDDDGEWKETHCSDCHTGAPDL